MSATAASTSVTERGREPIFESRVVKGSTGSVECGRRVREVSEHGTAAPGASFTASRGPGFSGSNAGTRTPAARLRLVLH
jgi:hypothetical protein